MFVVFQYKTSYLASDFGSAFDSEYQFREGLAARSRHSYTVWDALGVPIGVSTFTDTGTLGVSPDAKCFA